MPRYLLFLPLLCACLPHASETPPPAAESQVVVDPAAPYGPQRSPDAPADPVRPGSSGHHTVALGTLSTDDSTVGPVWTLALGQVAAEVERNAGLLQRCYETRLEEVPGLEGAISIHAHITPAGQVDGQCIGDDSMNDPVLVECVNTLIARGRYPTGHAATVDVTFPFVFTPPPKRG